MFLGIVSNTICFHFAEEFVEKDGFHGKDDEVCKN